ncbi:NAD+ synthase [soil metagenome]
MLTIDAKQETTRIVSFLKQTFEKQGISHAVIGISGGIDSATSLFLLKQVLSPSQITAIHLPYTTEPIPLVRKILETAGYEQSNVHNLSIKKSVDILIEELHISEPDYVRRGNIMARVRMIYLFDQAKKHNAMVVGTENRSEHYLGYFTRFGDSASDIEPLVHLYKTQIRQLAQHLGVPQEVIDQPPTAGLWNGQTDEKEFGFSYKEADEVLFMHFQEKYSLEQIIKQGYKNGEQILAYVQKNSFKLNTPYSLL